jgi:hypothetical protein
MAAKKPGSNFGATFAGLKEILARHSVNCVVATDTSDCYALNSAIPHPTNKQPMMLGAVRTGKNYVSFHLMPIYCNPKLQAALSPALKKRMQGKACFNFTEPDEALFRELAEVTERSIVDFKKMRFM